MKFTPDYGVFYRDGFHAAGEPFEILAEDAEEMKQHGRVEGLEAEAEAKAEAETPAPAPAPKPKRTRKKAE